jgi:hypothetical protein
MPAGSRRAARREARKPARSVSGEDARRAVRLAITLFSALNYRFLRLRRKLWQLARMSCRAVLADTSGNQGFTTRFLHRGLPATPDLPMSLLECRTGKQLVMIHAFASQC